MKLLRSLIGYILIATALAAVYGILHDQLTYTLSREYYTLFKFDQFQLVPELRANERLGAVVVGIGATWWVGTVIGVILGLLRCFRQDFATLFGLKRRALGLVFGTAVFAGLVGWLVGHAKFGGRADWPITFIDERGTDPLTEALKDPDVFYTFFTCGTVHNFSYLGGLLGLGVAVVWVLRKTRNQ